MFDLKLLKNFDWFLVILIFVLVIVGLLAISSATHVHESGNYSYLKKQILWFCIGLIAIFVILCIDYDTFGDFYIYLYVIGISLLIAVLIFGERINGAKSWFVFNGIGLQPGEFVKIICIISFSKHIQLIKEKSLDIGEEHGINNLFNLIKLLIHIGIPIILIMKQPDWGTASVFIVITFSIIFIAGLNIKYIIGAVLGISAIIPLMYYYVMEGYQKKRIISFLNPESDPLGTGYNVIQSKIAIGSGRIWGKGLFNGTQTQMGYLPEQETDFIFSVIGEELGFIWATVIVLIYILMLMRLIYLSTQAKDEFGSYLIIGVAMMIFSHVTVNIGMTLGLVPIMGIPLPFISYGGSSLLTNMIAIGIVLNVSMRRQRLNFK